MKSAGTTLQSILYGQNVWTRYNLYAFWLGTGLLCLTDAAQDISTTSQTAGAQTFVHSGQNIRRTRSKVSSDGSVDDAEVIIDMGTLNGLGLPMNAILGAFDGVRCSVEKVFLTGSYTDASAGTVLDVDGIAYPADISSTSLRLTVKSYTDRLTEQLPKRLVQAGCPYAVYGPGCSLASASFTDHLTVAAGGTATVVNSTTMPVQANSIGWVVFKTGQNAGVSRPIRSVSGAGVVLTLPLPFAPAPGDTFDAFKGCDKTRPTCGGTFNNLVNFGGFPDAPPSVMQS